MMDENERRDAELIRDRLKKILPELKLAYANAKSLEFEHYWDINCFDICEAYMTLAEAYIGVMEVFAEDDGGAK